MHSHPIFDETMVADPDAGHRSQQHGRCHDDGDQGGLKHDPTKALVKEEQAREALNEILAGGQQIF